MMMMMTSSSLSVSATPKTGIIAGSANDKRKTAVKNNKNTDDGLWNAKIAFDDDDDDANNTNEKETQQHKGMSTRRRQLAMSAAVASVALSVGRPMEAQALSLKGKNKNGVYWIEPKNNATVTSPFTARFGVKGYEVVPASTEFEEGTGHHHVIVDGDYMERGTVIPADATHLHYGKAQKEGEITLEPGTHTLTLQFANGKHVSYGKKFASTITVVVE